jgi:hypothetical protein
MTAGVRFVPGEWGAINFVHFSGGVNLVANKEGKGRGKSSTQIANMDRSKTKIPSWFLHGKCPFLSCAGEGKWGKA